MKVSALLTDLYQFTMLQAYYKERLRGQAVFEFFIRRLPAGRNFFMAAGLEQLLDYLENLRFTADELEWLKGTGFFTAEFVDQLAAFRFTGDVDAMPEGTVCFPDEPLVRVVAPLPEAQLIESRLVNIVHFQTLIASKAARCVLAAPGKTLIDFGMRRAHGAEAALYAARAGYIAGFSGTATVLAGRRFGIPMSGTMAHSYIQAHDREEQAFERFAETQPGNVTLLIDTYDTEAAARLVVRLAPRLAARGITIRAVRLDSGDLGAHARQVRAILDSGGLGDVRIFASGNIDEYKMRDLLAHGAPIDGFGIGTHLDTSADAPYLDGVYKLQEYAGVARRKRSEGKATWPGPKQVFRRYDPSGVTMTTDTLTTTDDPRGDEALLQPAMRAGRRVVEEPLETIRARAAEQLRRLPPALRAIEPAPAYPVTVAEPLRELAEATDRRLAGHTEEPRLPTQSR